MPGDTSFATDRDVMKKALHGAGRNSPARCAIVTLDDQRAVVTADRRKVAKKLARELKAAAEDAGYRVQQSYFGTAWGDDYPGTAVFQLNKNPPGTLQRKLIQALKGTGFGKVEITVDERFDEEG